MGVPTRESRMKRTVRTGSFEVIDEAGGRHTITEYTDLIENVSMDGTRETIKGLKSYKMPNGGHVNQLSDDMFAEVRTGKKLRRDPR
jgi:hypothetical protein